MDHKFNVIQAGMTRGEPERKIVQTADGSHTVLVPGHEMTYHSRHGAIQESVHVFIEAGLRHWLQLNGGRKVRIFELGFGTGLNALLTILEALNHNCEVVYTTIEPFPLEDALAAQLNYPELLGSEIAGFYFNSILQAPWQQEVIIHDRFSLHKQMITLADYAVAESSDLVYFDAFSPVAQPELWNEESFKKIYSLLNPGGLLTTYCSRSMVRRTMTSSGFRVEKIPGPWGKREMVRAYRDKSYTNV